MPKRKDLALPKPTKGDHAHTVVRTILSAILGVGGPAVELFNAIIQPPLTRRRDEWMKGMGEKFQELEDRGMDVEKLSQDEAFVSTVMQATTVVMRTHQQEKLEALRNAVLNVALKHAPEDAVQHMFLRWVDDFSPLHLRILKFFQAPSQANFTMGALSTLLERSMPEMIGKRHVYDQVWKDLYANGLVTTDSLHSMMSGNGMNHKRTSELGDALIRFIAEPPELAGEDQKN